MKFAYSIAPVAMVFASMLFLGCGAVESDGNVVETQMALENEAQEADYGSEMLPLALQGNNASIAGDSYMPNGRVTPQEVVRQAMDRIDALRSCYEAALIADPAFSGEVRAVMDFRSDGSMQSMHVADASALDPNFVDCMTNELSTMHLPASNGGVLRVIYPIALNAAVFASGQ